MPTRVSPTPLHAWRTCAERACLQGVRLSILCIYRVLFGRMFLFRWWCQMAVMEEMSAVWQEIDHPSGATLEEFFDVQVSQSASQSSF